MSTLNTMKKNTILKPEQVIDTICKALNISVFDALYAQTRKSDITDCRHLIYFFLRKYCVSQKNNTDPLQYPAIGKLFKKNHASIINGVNKIEMYIKYNKEFKEKYDVFNTMLIRLGEPDFCVFCNKPY